MTELESMLAVGWNSGDPFTRRALADALEESGYEDDADRQRALAELLARHETRFTTVTIAREWREGGPENRYRVLLVADGQCHATGPSGLIPAASPPTFWVGPAGEVWMARDGAWHHGYACIIYDPDEPDLGVEHLDFIGGSPDEVIDGLNEFQFEAGRHVLIYLTGTPSKEMHWFRCDGETWEEIDPPDDPTSELIRTGHYFS
jgi:hypothetical protein